MNNISNNGGVYDLVIIGSGPAGLSASVYAGRARMRTLVLEKLTFSGGQILKTEMVDNYLGFYNTNGFQLVDYFKKHADALKTDFVSGEVRGIKKASNGFNIICNDSEYFSKSVIIASGASHKLLNVKGESEFSGKGVSYCATCDGFFFRDKTVIVVGGGDTALEDAVFLSKQCKKVYLVHHRDKLKGSKILQESFFALHNTEIVWNSKVTEIVGDKTVTGVSVEQEDGGIRNIEAQGIFIAIGIHPNTEPFSDIVKLDKNEFIEAGEDCLTSMPGIFAAGDIRTKPLRQIVTAAADGANAVFSVEKYLATVNH